MQARNHRHPRLWWKIGLFAADLASGAVSLYVPIALGRGSLTVSEAWTANAWSAALLITCWPIFSLVHPGYLPRPHRPLITTAHQCLLAVAAGSATCVGVLYVLAPGNLAHRGVILPASVVMFALMVATRHLAGTLGSREVFAERYLILGDGDRCRLIARELLNGHSPYKEIAGLIPIYPAEAEPSGVPVVGDPASAPAIVRERDVTHLVVCHPQPLPEQVARCVAECEAAGAHVHAMEAIYESLTRRVPLFHVGDEWIASLDESAQTLYATRIKRALDVVLAAVGLVLLGPLILLLALLVKLTSRGPAFYSQERVGVHGRPFVFTKLRTMVEDAEADTGPVWACEDDPRITPLGRVLRKCRLDELPQLWSVLKGDMSMVGPRPERQHFVEQLRQEVPLYTKRLLVLPGLTGWAQVHHGYDACVEDVIEKLRYDLFYVNHVSLKLDLLVMLKTVSVVLFGKGAH